jgi:hypothetical protein
MVIKILAVLGIIAVIYYFNILDKKENKLFSNTKNPQEKITNNIFEQLNKLNILTQSESNQIIDKSIPKERNLTKHSKVTPFSRRLKVQKFKKVQSEFLEKINKIKFFQYSIATNYRNKNHIEHSFEYKLSQPKKVFFRKKFLEAKEEMLNNIIQESLKLE